MKMIVAVPFALVVLSVLGCSGQAGTATDVHPKATASDTNMFGENKEAATGSAADARAAAYGTDQAPAAGPNAPNAAGPAQTTPPK